MDIRGWEERYRSRERAGEDFNAPATPLLIETAQRLKPGKALDLACGTGRNALWLAAHGWAVTAVDASATAIRTLSERSAELQLQITSVQADLVRGEYRLEPSHWDLIAICYYLQRDLFEPAKRGVVEGGILLAIVHITEPGETQAAHRMGPGELAAHFKHWEVLHLYEGKPNDTAHRRSVAEIVARRPSRSTRP